MPVRPDPAPASLDVLFVSGDLAGGGAQRVLVNLAEALQARSHRVRILTLYGPEDDRYAPPPGVARLDLGMARAPSVGVLHGLRQNMMRVRRVRSAIEKLAPRVTVSFLPEINVTTLLASPRTGPPVVVTEHIDPRFDAVSKPWRLLRRISYRRARALVSVSTGVDRQFDWLRGVERFVIPNLLVRSFRARPTRPTRSARTVVGMGRLTPQKGFDLLLRAFQAARAHAPEWQLCVYGEGEERDRLAALAAALGIADAVAFPGWAADADEALARADLFVLSSRFEGFGNVIVEAMAVGTPVVSFDCPSGPSDIVQSGENGLLVPAGDVDALALAMTRMMTDGVLRDRLAKSAAAGVERFTFATVAGRWETLLQHVERSRG